MNNVLKICVLLLLSDLWLRFAGSLVGMDAVVGAYVILAIYFRFRYFRNSQMIPTLIPEVVNEQ